jgi:hypothetical protein
LLGLVYNFKTCELSSETRGRNENKIKRTKKIEPQQKVFKFERDTEFENKYEDSFKDLNFMLRYKDLNLESMFSEKVLEKYFNTIVSYLYKGNRQIVQNFSLKNCKKGSLL